MPAPSDEIKRLINAIKIVPEDEAEKSDFVVCGYPNPKPNYPDDVNTFCSECGMGIVHRPHAPKKPPKICPLCFRQFFSEKAGEIQSTGQAIDDVFTFINKSKAGADIIKKKYGQ